MNRTVFIVVNFDVVVMTIVISPGASIFFVIRSQKHVKHLCENCRRKQDSPDFELVDRQGSCKLCSRSVPQRRVPFVLFASTAGLKLLYNLVTGTEQRWLRTAPMPCVPPTTGSGIHCHLRRKGRGI